MNVSSHHHKMYMYNNKSQSLRRSLAMWYDHENIALSNIL